jgi:hypothetical protein
MPQYSQNVSDQIMKSDGMGSGLPWRLLAFSIFLFSLSLLVYAALSFGYATYLNNQILNTEEETKALTGKISVDSQNKFIDVYSRLSNFKGLLVTHVYSTKAFPLLEKITYPSVYYNNVELSADERRMVLSGIAANFDALSRQLKLYDDEKNSIESYILNQSRIVDNMVNFRVSLNLSPKLFQK